MRMTIILALLSSTLISCATIQGLVGESKEPQSTEEASLDGALPQTSPDLMAPAASADQAYTNHEMGDSSQAPAELQAAEQQTAHAEAMNEQRSNSELDAAAPESSGTDSFYASTNTTPGMPPEVSSPEVEQVTPEPTAQLPTELPEKGASWDQAAANATPETNYEEPQHEAKPVFKKSSKKSKKHIAKKDKKKKHIAKKDKKSKKQLAKKSKKSKKQIAKKSKSKYDCKKIAKNTKKASKREIASCKAEIRKVASVKSKKIGKLAKGGCQCEVR